MTIAVFGASGAIGHLFVNLALKEGHQVQQYSRKKDGLPQSEKAKVIVGELTVYDRVKEAIKGTDSVVSFFLGQHTLSSQTLQGNCSCR
jgi:putative NADH-flavin reductase